MSTSLFAHSLSVETLHRLDDFNHYLFEQGLNPATITSYVTDVRQFHEYLAGMSEPNAMPPTRLHITRYRNHLLDLRLKVATMNKKVNSLAAYDRYLLEKGLLKSPIVHPGGTALPLPPAASGRSKLSRTRKSPGFCFIRNSHRFRYETASSWKYSSTPA